MKKFSNLLLLISIFVFSQGMALGATHRVPQDFQNIQDAVDAASAGDVIRVGPGEWCGATITKQLELVGEGNATIKGCSTSPKLAGVLRIGFFLSDTRASGSVIRHFHFDGRAISNGNLDPLSFAIFSRESDNVLVEQNTVHGTVQAITNTNGSGWIVNHNTIKELSVFDCDDGFCGGGVGIVFQDRNTTGPRQKDNTAMFNYISGVIPDNFDVFDFAGIIVLGAQDGSVIQKNRIAIPDNTTSDAKGQAILVTDVCCGLLTAFSTAINSTIVKNDGRNSEVAAVITKDSGGGNGNSVGTFLRGNFGTNNINSTVTNVTNRSIATIQDFR